MVRYSSAKRMLGLGAACLLLVAGMVNVGLAQVAPGAGPERAAPPKTPLDHPAPITTTDFPHVSVLFTVADIVFFSHHDGTMLQLFDSGGVLIWNNGGAPLNKGGHASVAVAQGVYRAEGSEKFAVLTGDPITRNVMGYFAMDQNGFGASTELYTWVPTLYLHCKFIVFAYNDATNVTVERTDTGVDIASFVLQKGEHWDSESLSAEWLHVTANKPVSALTCYDQGYFVPSASGRWSGTEFFTYVSDIAGWPQDLSVIAFDDNTDVMIRDTDTDALIWSGTLDSGEAHVQSYPSGADQFFTITSSKSVTVCSVPWVSMTSNYHQGTYVQDRNGAGIGTDLIGSTLNGGYLHVLAYKDNTTVQVRNSQTGTLVSSHNLNRGESVQANPGNGLWRILSDKYVSAYAGWGEWNAGFAPVEFGEVVNPLGLSKDDGLEPDECVQAGNDLSYEICYSNAANGFPVDNVVLTDQLPALATYVSATGGGAYDAVSHSVTWNIGTLPAFAPEECQGVVVQVDPATPKGSVIENVCTIVSDQTPPTSREVQTLVCSDCDLPSLSLVGYRTVDYSPPLWTVQVEIANAGPGVAKAVGARMNEDIPWLGIPDPNCFYGEIPNGASSWGEDGYTFDLTNHPGGSFNVWFDVSFEDTCGGQHTMRLDPEFDPGAATGIGASTFGYSLSQNYPNPFNPTTEITYAIPVAGDVSLRVYDVSGKLVRTLVEGVKGGGAYTASWDGKDSAGRFVASGLYFYRMEAGRYIQTRRMVFLK